MKYLYILVLVIVFYLGYMVGHNHPIGPDMAKTYLLIGETEIQLPHHFEKVYPVWVRSERNGNKYRDVPLWAKADGPYKLRWMQCHEAASWLGFDPPCLTRD